MFLGFTIHGCQCFKAYFPKFPLMPGVYRVHLYCAANGVTSDWVKDAVTIHVVEGDYYGSGKLPPKGWGHVAAAHDWEILDDSVAHPSDLKQSHSSE